ncbi:MAG: hypothetical protein HOQ29_14255 [Acidobacteria bacterium]|nr:hypothetical protein [Acidobacteriota bacterium]
MAPGTRKQARLCGGEDVGTLWTLRHGGYTARCALLAWKTAWEISVLVDGDALLTERCRRTGDLFEVAERWRRRLVEEGWEQVRPPSPERVA